MTRKGKMRRARAAHGIDSLVGRAVLANAVRRDMEQIHRAAEIHAWTGNSAPELLDRCGRLVWVVLDAARVAGFAYETPEIRVIRGMAEALGDMRQDTDPDLHRQALQSGLEAIGRLLPMLNAFEMLRASQDLDSLLVRAHEMGTADLSKLLPTPAPQ